MFCQQKLKNRQNKKNLKKLNFEIFTKWTNNILVYDEFLSKSVFVTISCNFHKRTYTYLTRV